MPAEPFSRRIEHRLTTLFPSIALEDHAEVVGVVERDSKLQIPALVRTFVFRHSYNSTVEEPFSPGGFYQRLTPLFTAYLRDLVEFALNEVAVLHTVSDKFSRFRDVLIVDATVLRLHRFLLRRVPRPP